ncbi:MAG: S8 family serine peptidase [Planctomycetaceae bacterium]
MVDQQQAVDELPDSALMQHGTTVSSIAAGRASGMTPDGFSGGVAPEAKLIVVRYDTDGASIGYSSGHMDGLNFIDAIAHEKQLPVVVNISNGMNPGAARRDDRP